MMKRLAGAFCALMAIATASFGQEYPSKHIRIVVPYPPGGVTDLTARIVAETLSKNLGRQVVIDNRAGAAGNVGTDIVAKSPPDGYTLLVALVGNTISPWLYNNLPFDFVRDFDAVVQLTSSPNVLVVHPSVPAKSPQELIALAKAKPGVLNYGSTGSGTSTHLSGELFKLETGVDIVHVPYRGGAPAQAGLLSGQVQLMFDNIPVSIEHIRAGTLRGLATTGTRRSKGLEEVPTLVEAGIPGVVVEGWIGIVAPRGTPRTILDTLNREINRVLATPNVRARLEDAGAVVAGGSAESFRELISSETERWARVVRAANVKVEQ